MQHVEPMENCVDVVKYNARKLVVLKRPGSPRHPQGGAVEKIEMTVGEAKQMAAQLVRKLRIKEKFLYANTSDSTGKGTEQPRSRGHRLPVRVKRPRRRK